MEMADSPEGFNDRALTLTPLLESLTKLYSELPRGDTIRRSISDGTLDMLDTLDTLDTPTTLGTSTTLNTPTMMNTPTEFDELETLDSPSVYSMYIGPEDGEMTPRGEASPLPSPFTDQAVISLHDWDNGIHYREAKMFGVPEGRLLAKRAATIHLKNLLQARRREAGLSMDVTLDSPSDV